MAKKNWFLEPEQEEFLQLYNISVKDLKIIKGEKLHSYMIDNTGYTDGEKLIFFDDHDGGSLEEHKKFIYYMGAEKEAILQARHLGVTIYEGIDEDRLIRY